MALSLNKPKIIFGLSLYFSSGNGHHDNSNNQSKQIKNGLEAAGIKARFLLSKPGDHALSSVVVSKLKLTEVIIFQDGNKISLAGTIWVQDFEGWNKRDYGRPAVSPSIGMLPPKVARMMVNIGTSGQVLGSSLLDPFCGVGTILSEALILGNKVIGADINQKQIEKTQKNLDWISRTYNLEPNHFSLQIADARKVVIPPVDAIVTETYLGPDNKQFLENLYYDSLKHWKTILKPEGKVVIATPFPLDTRKLMGYSPLAGPFEYFRPQAIIKRYIWLIQKLPE